MSTYTINKAEAVTLNKEAINGISELVKVVDSMINNSTPIDIEVLEYAVPKHIEETHIPHRINTHDTVPDIKMRKCLNETCPTNGILKEIDPNISLLTNLYPA